MFRAAGVLLIDKFRSAAAALLDLGAAVDAEDAIRAGLPLSPTPLLGPREPSPFLGPRNPPPLLGPPYDPRYRLR